MNLKSVKLIGLFAVFLAFLSACQSDSNGGSEDDGVLNIVATTTIIADAIENIVGDKAKVSSLMGAGIDPHVYEATPSDLTLLKEADVIVYHGLKLEGKMNEIFAKMEDKTIVYSAAYEMENLIVLDESHDDPHTWFDVNLHMIGMEYVAAKLMKIDTANGDYYKTNAKEYATELMELDAYVSTQIETIPSQKRVLVSTHDAFEYFGKRYGVETHGIQGISTATEAGIKDITTTVDLVVENEIPIIFSEHSASSNTVEAVMEGAKEKGWEVSLAPSLYTDALGNEADGADTYIGMMKANVDNLVQSLTK